MKTAQKGSTITIVILVIILIVLVGAGAYLYQRRVQDPAPVTTTVPQPTTETAQQPAAPASQSTAPALPPHATPDPVTRVYADAKFGFSTVYPKAYTATTDKTGKVTTLAIANSGLTPITILRAINTADTSTGKWGKNVLSYSNSGWVTELQDENGKAYTSATVPFAFTDSGLPIFTGGTRHGFGLSVYVVALSHTKFLIISGGEGLTTATGYDYSTDPTLKVAKAVTAL